MVVLLMAGVIMEVAVSWISMAGDHPQYTITMAASSNATIYADGKPIGSSENDTQTITVAIPCETNILAIRVTHQSNDIGNIDSSTNQNSTNSYQSSTDYVTTPSYGNATIETSTEGNVVQPLRGFIASVSSGIRTGYGALLCSSSVSSDSWMYYGFSDSTWSSPQKVAQNSDGTFRKISDISDITHWVWTNQNEEHIHCRILICNDLITLSTIADDRVIVYFDGVLSTEYTSGSGNAPAVAIPCGTEIVALEAYNTAGSNGLVASMSNGWLSGVSPFVCSSSKSTGWMLKGYDDSNWKVPVHATQHSYLKVADIDPSAKVVWDSGGGSPMYCRIEVCDDQYIVASQCDNTVDIYSDGVLIGQTLDWDEVIQGRVRCGCKLLAFEGKNEGVGPFGFIASVGPGDIAVTGDGSFRCTPSSSVTDSSWKTDPDYDDSWWWVPYRHTDGDHIGSSPYISTRAKVVWLQDNGQNSDTLQIKCRVKLPAYYITTAVPTTITTGNKTVTTSSAAMTTEEMTTLPPIEQPTVIASPREQYEYDYAKLQQFSPTLSQIPERNALPQTGNFRRQEEMFQILSELDDAEKRELGFQVNEMIYECRYNKDHCFLDDFGWFYDGTHGNCHVFNAGWNEAVEKDRYNSYKPGSRSGLRFNMDVMQYKYIPVVGQAAGVVLVVHDPHRMPFPEDEGILAMPGREVHINIRQIKTTRLPQPYGNCEESTANNYTRNLFEEHYPVNYSFSSCMKTCYQRHVVERCGCGDPVYPIKGQALGNNTRPCNVNNQQQDDCKYTVNKLFTDNQLECDCEIPCTETTFKYTTSSMLLPNEVYGEYFEEVMMKTQFPFLRLYDTSEYRRNIISVYISYETFNYQEIRESPAYPLDRLLIDIGGIIGLWIGLSVLGLLEIVELGLDFFVLLLYKCSKRPYWGLPHKVTSKPVEEPERSSINVVQDEVNAPDENEEVPENEVPSEPEVSEIVSPSLVSIGNDGGRFFAGFRGVEETGEKNAKSKTLKKRVKKKKVAPANEFYHEHCYSLYWK